MIPHCWRICNECGARDDVEREAPEYWLCFDCHHDPTRRQWDPRNLAARYAANEASARLGGVRVVLVVAAFAVACSGPAFSEAPEAERFGAVGYDFPPGSQCVLLPEVYHAPAGLCFRVTADEWSTLAACEGTTPTNYVGKTWTNPTSYPTSSFEIEGGGCFQFYNCTPEGVLAPEVDPC